MRIQPLGDALDHASLAGRIAPFQEDHHLLFFGLPPSPAA
jgi:hypothetical protein